MVGEKINAIVLSLFFLALVWADNSLAMDSYRTEFAFNYYRYRQDGGVEGDYYMADASIHFAPVEHRDHPLAEAAFLERIGAIYLRAGRMEADLGSGISADSPLYTLAVQYMRPEFPLALQAHLQTWKWEYDLPYNDISLRGEEYSLGAGWFLLPGGMAYLQYTHGETKASGLNYTSRSNQYTLGGKYVNKLAGRRAYNLEGSLSLVEERTQGSSDTNNILEIAGDFYLNPLLGLGGGLSLNRGDDSADEGKGITVRATGFVTPRFSARLSLTKFLADRSAGDDHEAVDLVLAARF